MLDGHPLRDHAAHGQPDDVRTALAEVVEEVHGVLRHVGERVVRCHGVAGREQGLQRRRRAI